MLFNCFNKGSQIEFWKQEICQNKTIKNLKRFQINNLPVKTKSKITKILSIRHNFIMCRHWPIKADQLEDDILPLECFQVNVSPCEPAGDDYQHQEKSLGLVRSSADTEVTSLITDHDAVSLPVPSAGPPRRQRIRKLSQSVESCRLPFSALLVLFYGHKNLFVVVCFGLSPPDSLSRRRAPAGKGWREQTEQRMKNKAAASSLSAAWFRLHPPVSVHIFSV